MTRRISIIIAGLALIFSSVETLKGSGFKTIKKIDMTSGWKYSPGDNVRFSYNNYNDEKWTEVDFSGADNEPVKTRTGYVWFRKTVDLEEVNLDHLYLCLGKINAVDEVYVNGHFAGAHGSFPPYYYTDAREPRSYRLREEWLSKGENKIAVRMYVQKDISPSIGSEAGIYSHDKFSSNTIDLSGSWKFHLSDKLKWADPAYNDKSWDEVYIPFKGTSYNFTNYNGSAWYRKSFSVEESTPTNGMIIVLGKLSDRDEVYVNGKRAIRTEDFDKQCLDSDHEQQWKNTQTFYIPEQTLKPGDHNVITARVFDDAHKDGIYKGALAIFPANEYLSFKEIYCSFKHGGEE